MDNIATRLVYTPAETAHVLGLGLQATRRYLADGTIGSIRFGPRRTRVPKIAVDLFIAEQLALVK